MRRRQSKPEVCLIAAAVTIAASVASSPAFAVDGTIVSPVTFTGPITGRSISFSLYLPPGYTGGSARYPVVYHLHGMGGAHSNSNQLTTVAQGHEAAVAAGDMPPAIIVFPDGATDSFWADAKDGSRLIETHVVQELVPHVDAAYRTLATRSQRAVQGFSMGGFGAAKFASKFPDRFCASVVYDGALVTWAVMQQFHAAIAASMFGNDEAYFNQYSPWHWVPQNAATLQTSVPFRQVVGTQVQSNQNFRNLLLANAVSSQYLETGCTHTLNCVMTAGGADSWALIGDAFGSAPPPTPTATPTPTPTATPGTNVEVTFTSIGAEDGWVLESGETTGTGGTVQPGWSGASGLLIGDDAGDRQYKAILSFDTSSIPDGATILSATVRVKRGTVVGTNPFGTHGSGGVDVRNGFFGGSSSLEAADFAATASAAQAGALGNPGADGVWSEAILNAAGRTAVSRTGRTQIRLSFATGDNDDMGADTVGWYPGENATASNRPQLIITYR